MKYLTSKQFFDLCETLTRANGKTTEAVRAALNLLINGNDRVVMYVGYNWPTCDYARHLAEQLITEANEIDPRFGFEITRSNRYSIEFESAFGRSVLRFTIWDTLPTSLRGMTLDEIFFDIDPAVMFKGNSENNRAVETCMCVAPAMAHRPLRQDRNIQIF